MRRDNLTEEMSTNLSCNFIFKVANNDIAVNKRQCVNDSVITNHITQGV